MNHIWNSFFQVHESKSGEIWLAPKMDLDMQNVKLWDSHRLSVLHCEKSRQDA